MSAKSCSNLLINIITLISVFPLAKARIVTVINAIPTPEDK